MSFVGTILILALDGSPFKGEISPEANKYRKQANLPLLPQPNPLSLPGNGVSNTKEEEKLTIQSSVRPEIAATTEKVNKFTTQSTIRPACGKILRKNTTFPFIMVDFSKLRTD